MHAADLTGVEGHGAEIDDGQAVQCVGAPERFGAGRRSEGIAGPAQIAPLCDGPRAVRSDAGCGGGIDVKRGPLEDRVGARGRRGAGDVGVQRAFAQPHDPVEEARVLQDQQAAAGLVDHAGPGLRDHGVRLARRHRDRQRVVHERTLRTQRRRDERNKAHPTAERFHSH